MTTMITVGNSEGSRRCDATCHDAKHDKCVCVCGGRNHGVGRQKALENTRQMAKAMLEYAAQHRSPTRRTHKRIDVREFDRRIAFAGLVAVADLTKVEPLPASEAAEWIEHVAKMDLRDEPEVPSGQSIFRANPGGL